MNYCIYKLNFLAPLHTGNTGGSLALTNVGLTLSADTVFSAVCNEASRTFGTDAVEKIIGLCKEGELLFSDTFPYYKDELYIPKPIFPLDDDVDFDVENRKRIKAAAWLPAREESLNAFAGYIHSGIMFDTEGFRKSFAKKVIRTRGCVNNETKDTVPYRIGVYEFDDDCGLYGIIGYENDEDLDLVLGIFSVMSFGGIGGSVSSGCGRFSFEIMGGDNDCADFMISRLDVDSDKYMLLTSALPKENELESALDGGYYSVVRRGGFSFSPQAAPAVKKKTQYFIGAGSVLRRRFDGDVYEAGKNKYHTIYRYSKPIFLGVGL